MDLDSWDPLGDAKKAASQAEQVHCPKCHFVGTDPQQCPRCGVIFARIKPAPPTNANAPRPGPPTTARHTAPTNTATEPLGSLANVAVGSHVARPLAGPERDHAALLKEATARYDGLNDDLWRDSFWLYALALPLCVLFAAMIQWSDGLKFLFWWPTVGFHEFGHAFVGWLASHKATPFVLWTNFSLEPSALVYVCFAFLLGVAAWAGVRERRYFITVVAGVLFVAQALMTFVVSDDGFHAAMSAGGMGGEFVLSTLVIVAFFYKLPQRFHWDFVRLLVLPIAVHTFVNAFWLWWRISDNFTLVPWGTAMYGQTDAGGDFNQLHDVHGWRIGDMVDFYVPLGVVCTLLIAGHYFWHLTRIHRLGRPQWRLGRP